MLLWCQWLTFFQFSSGIPAANKRPHNITSEHVSIGKIDAQAEKHAYAQQYLVIANTRSAEWELTVQGTLNVPSQMPNLLSLDAAVSFCPLLPNAVMVRSGSEPRNFLAVMIAPLLASLIHMYSM